MQLTAKGAKILCKARKEQKIWFYLCVQYGYSAEKELCQEPR